MSMIFHTKIVVVLRDNLEVWQKLNVAAFTISGIAATIEKVTGEPYVNATGTTYLPMFKQPVMIYEANTEKIRTVYDRVRSRDVEMSLFIEELFVTGNDIDNRAAMALVSEEELNIVGLAFRAESKIADKILKGVSLHR